MRETWVWSLGWEDPLEKDMATHSSILAWKISRTEEPGGLQSMGSQRIRLWLSAHTHIQSTKRGLPWWLSGKESACQAGDVNSVSGLGRSPEEGNGNPLQYFCLGNSINRGAWWAPVHGVTESDMTEQVTHFLGIGSCMDRAQYEWMEDERGGSRAMDLGVRTF